MSDNTTPTTVSYGDFKADLSDLPQASVVALVRKGLAHYLGNEMASRVSSQKADFAKDHPDGELTDEQVAQWKREAFTTGVEAIRSGNIGANSRGPRGTSLDTEARRIAEAELRANLATAKLSMPTGKDTITVQGKPWTRAEMIEARLAGPHGDRIRKEAQRNLDKLAKQASKVADAGEEVSLLDL